MDGEKQVVTTNAFVAAVAYRNPWQSTLVASSSEIAKTGFEKGLDGIRFSSHVSANEKQLDGHYTNVACSSAHVFGVAYNHAERGAKLVRYVREERQLKTRVKSAKHPPVRYRAAAAAENGHRHDSGDPHHRVYRTR